jgi:hypothetical protein
MNGARFVDVRARFLNGFGRLRLLAGGYFYVGKVPSDAYSCVRLGWSLFGNIAQEVEICDDLRSDSVNRQK